MGSHVSFIFMCFSVFFFLPCYVACRINFPTRDWTPRTTLAVVLITGPPGNSSVFLYFPKNPNNITKLKNLKRSERDKCTPMFIAALFIIARTWKQPRCPSADEWIRKLWYIYTMEYYSAIKKNSFESALMRWMKLEPIIQSEVSQKDKDHYSILTHIYGI